jgi:DNA-binding transcriptional MerR regulator
MTMPDQFLCEPRFRASQVHRICQVDSNNLLDWHRRGFVPEARSVKGRGKRRRYSIQDVIQISTVHLFSAASLPLRESCLLVDLMVGAFARYWGGQTLAECLAIVRAERDGQWQSACLLDSGLREYMHKRGMESAVVFDISWIVLTLADRIRRELGTEAQKAA